MVVSLDKFTVVKMYDKVQRLWKEQLKDLRGQITRSVHDLEKRRLPNEFTNVTSTQGGNLQYDSLDLCKKNAKLQHSLNDIYVLSFETIMNLIDHVRMYIGCLYKVCEGTAMLDMVMSQLKWLISANLFRILYNDCGHGTTRV